MEVSMAPRGVHAYQENTAKHLINFHHKVPEVKPSPLLQLETETVWIDVEGCNHHVLVGISEIECGNPRGIESAVGRVFSVSTTKSGDRQGFPTEPGLMIVAEPDTERSLLDKGV